MKRGLLLQTSSLPLLEMFPQFFYVVCLQNHDYRYMESSGDAKISYPRLRLEIDLRYVGSILQTR